MPSDPAKRNYSSIDLDYEKDKEEWTTNERRAHLIKKIEQDVDVILPSDINYSTQAEKFSVSVQTISNDIDVLADRIEETIGEDEEMLAKQIFIEGAKEEKRKGNNDKASRILDRYASWLENRGYKEKEANDETEVNVNLG